MTQNIEKIDNRAIAATTAILGVLTGFGGIVAGLGMGLVAYYGKQMHDEAKLEVERHEFKKSYELVELKNQLIAHDEIQRVAEDKRFQFLESVQKIRGLKLDKLLLALPENVASSKKMNFLTNDCN